MRRPWNRCGPSLRGQRVYRIWQGMLNRCRNPNVPCYPWYGGRGITVCERWKPDVGYFLADMGHPPSPQHSLDRIDCNGNYTPANCRWATHQEQMNNTTSNVLATIDGHTLTIAEWARFLGIKPDACYRRIYAGMTPEEAVRSRMKAA